MNLGSITQLFSAQHTLRIGEDQAFTGIYKTPVDSAMVGPEGITGDIQADRRVHGGPEKALHQYAVGSYARMAASFPRAAAQLVIGSMGENISNPQMDEHNVHIGDIYRMGEVVVQVAQPRNPCWKINSKFDEDGLATFVAEQHINGWYYRVLEGGIMRVGDPIKREERLNPVSIHQLLAIYHQHRPALNDLQALLDCRGLNSNWQQKLQQRLDFLTRQD